MNGGRVPGWVWVVLVAAHALAWGWALRSGRWDFPDSGRYLQAAQNLRAHGALYARSWPVIPPQGQAVQEFTIRTLGYPLVALALGADRGQLAVLLVLQNLLSLVNIGVVLRWWARRGNHSHFTWALAVLGILAFPAQLIYANAVMSEVLLQTAVMALMAASLLFIAKTHTRYLAWASGAMIVGALLKPVFAPMTVVMAGVGLVLAFQRKKLRLAFIGLVPLGVVLVYMGWNQQRTGYFHYSSIADINLLHYNAAGLIRQQKGAAAEEAWVADVLREANAQPGFAARQRVIQRRAGRMLSDYPLVYARQHAQGMAAFFLDPGRFDVSQFWGLAPPLGGGLQARVRTGGLLRAVGRMPLGLLALLGAVLLANSARLLLAVWGFWQLRNGRPELRYGRWVAAGLILYVALLTGPLGATRFLVPVWPLLLGLALVGLENNEDLASEQAPVVREN